MLLDEGLLPSQRRQPVRSDAVVLVAGEEDNLAFVAAHRFDERYELSLGLGASGLAGLGHPAVIELIAQKDDGALLACRGELAFEQLQGGREIVGRGRARIAEEEELVGSLVISGAWVFLLGLTR